MFNVKVRPATKSNLVDPMCCLVIAHLSLPTSMITSWSLRTLHHSDAALPRHFSTLPSSASKNPYLTDSPFTIHRLYSEQEFSFTWQVSKDLFDRDCCRRPLPVQVVASSHLTTFDSCAGINCNPRSILVAA